MVRTLVNGEHREVTVFFATIVHPVAGYLTYPGAPYRFSASPWSLRVPAPTLGQHNEELYCGRLGISQAELNELRLSDVI